MEGASDAQVAILSEMDTQAGQSGGSSGAAISNDIVITWSKVNSDFPFAVRDGHAACTVGRRLYVFGGVIQGEGDEILETNDLICFDLDSQTWCKVLAKGSLPPARSATAMCSVGSNIYIFAGLSQDCGWFNDLHCFDTETCTWSVVAAEGTPPSPRDKLTIVTMDTNIYLFGGFGPKDIDDDEIDDEDDDGDEDGEVWEEMKGQDGAEFGWFNDLYIFNTVTSSWSQPLQMNLGVPTPRAAHAMCTVGRDLVIFGGRDNEARQNDLNIFNVDTRKWDLSLAVKGQCPAARSFHTITAAGQRAIVMGGRGVTDNHFNDMHIFDRESQEWLQPKISGDIPSARSLHSVVLIDDSLVLYGGSSKFDKDIMQCREFHSDTYITKISDLLSGSKKSGSLQNGTSH